MCMLIRDFSMNEFLERVMGIDSNIGIALAIIRVQGSLS